MARKSEITENICTFCSKKFSNQSNLYRHVKKLHKSVQIREQLQPIKCLENNCDFACRSTERLSEHLSEDHSMNFIYVTYIFKSRKEYVDWKIKVERHTQSCYIQVSGKKKKNEVTRTYFYCNRTGRFKTKGTGQRRLKGTIKIGGHCTSHYVLTEQGDDKMEVKFCKTHYGHTCEIQHLKLSKKEKRSISNKISQGIAFDAILDAMRENLGDDFKIIQNTTETGTKNIDLLSFNTLNLLSQFENDEQALVTWVEHFNKCLSDRSPIKLFKVIKGNQENVFNLIIMTQSQIEALKKYGPEQTVCVDFTCEAKNDLFNLGLTTITIINDSKRAFPVAFLISNQQDLITMKLFFETVKQNTGIIVPASLMTTEDNEIVPLAWQSVMGEFKARLLCPWNVDIAWRKNLDKVNDINLRVGVYKNLRALAGEICIEKFTLLLNETLYWLSKNEDSREFGKYFDDNYKDRTMTWAYCYSRTEDTNINIELEATHNVLKQIYLTGIESKRLDISLFAILKYTRDINFEQRVEIAMADNSLNVPSINEWHEQGSLLNSEIRQLGAKIWTITSEIQNNCVYSIELFLESCSCTTTCSICGVCVHMYRCSCPESLVNVTICQHIHHLINKASQNVKFIPEEITVRVETCDMQEEDAATSFSNIPSCSPSCSQSFSELQVQMDTLNCLEQKRSEALSEIQNLIHAVQNANSVESINTALKEVKSILSMAQASDTGLQCSQMDETVNNLQETASNISPSEIQNHTISKSDLNINNLLHAEVDRMVIEQPNNITSLNEAVVNLQSNSETPISATVNMHTFQEVRVHISDDDDVNNHLDLITMQPLKPDLDGISLIVVENDSVHDLNEINIAKNAGNSKLNVEQETITLWLQSDSNATLERLENCAIDAVL